MANKSKSNKKKVVVSTPKKKIAPTKARTSAVKANDGFELIFNKQNYILMASAFLIIVIGLFLMSGGHMPDDNTWDDSIIYSFRRTVLAPIVIIIGLGVGVYSIFKK